MARARSMPPPRRDNAVDESLHEHQEVKETLAALQDMDPTDAAYDQKVAALIADVRHHVEEEEGEMFPKLRSALSAEQLHDIGQKLADGKAKAPTHPHPAAPASGPKNRPSRAARSSCLRPSARLPDGRNSNTRRTLMKFGAIST